MGDSQKKGHISTRFDGEPFMGMGGRLGKARVQNNEFTIVLHGGHQVHAVRRYQGFEAVGAGHDDVFAVEHISRGNHAVRIQKRPVTAEEAIGLMGDDIVGAIDRGQSVHEGGLHICARHEQKPATGVGPADAFHLFRAQIQSLIPGQALPFTLTNTGNRAT